jgi:hypothetical protein
MGTVIIRFDDKEMNKESLTMEYVSYVSKLSHYHYDTFRFALHDFAIGRVLLVTFTTGTDGRVTGLDAFSGDETIHFDRDPDAKKD